MNLDQPQLEAALINEWSGDCDLELFATLGSTNRHLVLNLAEIAAPVDYVSGSASQCKVCVTDKQTAGVGRQGKTWHSPQNSITFSILRSFEQPASDLMGLSLVTGIAVAEVLSAYLPVPVELKWPNDLLVEGRKLGGILIELPRTSPSGTTTVTGIGINLGDGPEHQHIDQPYVTLASLSTSPLPPKSVLIGTLAGRVLATYATFAEHGWAIFAERWQDLDYLAGKSVQLSSGGNPIYGVASGVAADGGLIVQQGTRQQTYYSGDVSVRVAK